MPHPNGCRHQDPDNQRNTVKKLEALLGHNGKSLADATLSKLQLKKQQQKDLSEVVENWDEVVSWGYGGKLEEWEDLFAAKEMH